MTQPEAVEKAREIFAKLKARGSQKFPEDDWQTIDPQWEAHFEKIGHKMTGTLYPVAQDGRLITQKAYIL